VSLESALERWKLLHEDQKSSITDYACIVEEWKSRDKVAKFLDIYSSRRMYSDWKVAEPSEKKQEGVELGKIPVQNINLLQAYREFNFEKLSVPLASTRKK